MALTAASLYPSALSTPICVRSSSTMRVMVVMHTSMAMSMKKKGKIFAMPLMMEVSLSKLTYPAFSPRVST